MRLLLTLVLAIAPVAAQAADGVSFETASLKERDLRTPLGLIGLQRQPGRLVSRCVTLNSLLYFAYNLTGASPIEGLPGWANAPCSDFASTDTYEFQATLAPETSDTDARTMMQSFLAERFKLVIRRETKQRPIYALAVAAGGFKLKPTDPKDDKPRAPGSLACPVDDRGCHLIAGATSTFELAGALSRNAGRPVIDRTGLDGSYDFTFQWAGDNSPNSPLPSLTTQLKDKFGLELKPGTGPVDVLIIEHAEKPSSN